MSANEKPSGEAGREPEDDTATSPGGQRPDESYPVPLFLRDGNEGTKGDAQDEKDGTGE